MLFKAEVAIKQNAQTFDHSGVDNCGIPKLQSNCWQASKHSMCAQYYHLSFVRVYFHAVGTKPLEERAECNFHAAYKVLQIVFFASDENRGVVRILSKRHVTFYVERDIVRE